MISLHIIAGVLSLIAGSIALYATKGAWLHRRSGRIFAYAMFAMTGLAALIATFTRPNRGNLIVATLVCYLVATGLLAVIRTIEQQRRWLWGLSLFAVAATLSGWALGAAASASPDGRIDHFPPEMFFMFATIGTLALVGDARVLWSGHIEGARRLSRHLWRMCFALLIAMMSLFMGQTRHLPQWLRDSHLNSVPVWLVLGAMLFWLVRVRIPKKQSRLKAAPTKAGATLSGTGA